MQSYQNATTDTIITVPAPPSDTNAIRHIYKRALVENDLPNAKSDQIMANSATSTWTHNLLDGPSFKSNVARGGVIDLWPFRAVKGWWLYERGLLEYIATDEGDNGGVYIINTREDDAWLSCGDYNMTCKGHAPFSGGILNGGAPDHLELFNTWFLFIRNDPKYCRPLSVFDLGEMWTNDQSSYRPSWLFRAFGRRNGIYGDKIVIGEMYNVYKFGGGKNDNINTDLKYSYNRRIAAINPRYLHEIKDANPGDRWVDGKLNNKLVFKRRTTPFHTIRGADNREKAEYKFYDIVPEDIIFDACLNVNQASKYNIDSANLEKNICILWAGDNCGTQMDSKPFCKKYISKKPTMFDTIVDEYCKVNKTKDTQFCGCYVDVESSFVKSLKDDGLEALSNNKCWNKYCGSQGIAYQNQNIANYVCPPLQICKQNVIYGGSQNDINQNMVKQDCKTETNNTINNIPSSPSAPTSTTTSTTTSPLTNSNITGTAPNNTNLVENNKTATMDNNKMMIIIIFIFIVVIAIVVGVVYKKYNTTNLSKT